jgi:putative phage-type endonuclease
MKLIDLVQGTPEWHEFRRKHIGASECAAIMKGGCAALHVYKSKEPDYLDETNAAQFHGQKTEGEARDFFKFKHDIEWIPVVGEHEDYPWMSASLDGWDGFTVLEIKCPVSEERFAKIKITDEAPKDYIWQVQHQLCVSEAKAAILAFYFKQDTGIQTHEICIAPDPEMIKSLIEKERVFWFDNILAKVPPEYTPRHSKRGTRLSGVA